MDLKSFMQNPDALMQNNTVELDAKTLERFKNQAAVMPDPIRVGDMLFSTGEIKWIATLINQGTERAAQIPNFVLYVTINSMDETAEVNRISYAQITRRQQRPGTITPADVATDPVVAEMFPEDKYTLEPIFTASKSMTTGELAAKLSQGTKIVLAGRKEVDAFYDGQKTSVNIDKYCFVIEK